jgi:hypothetical protein
MEPAKKALTRHQAFVWRLVRVVLLSAATGNTCVASTNEPISFPPRVILTNGSPVLSKDRSVAPPSMVSIPLPQSPAPVTNFLSWVGDLVPDTFGAVGTNVVMTMINYGISFHTKSGVLLGTTGLDTFWNSTNFGSPAPFDPRLIYDPFNHRWIATAAGHQKSTNSSILLGVSRTSNPTNFGDAGWNLRSVKADTNSEFWADYPTVGLIKTGSWCR